MKPVFAAALVACTTLVLTAAAGAATLSVAAGGDLQAALNAAQPGDTILLAAGATFTGPYKLPAKNGSSYITIRSSTADSSLPPAGTRITPSYAPLLAKIVAPPSGGPAIRTNPGSSYWRILFIEVHPTSSSSAANLIEFGAADSTQTSLSSVPHHLIVDRAYIHGDATYGQRRGIALNSGDTQILNSYFSDFKQVNTDTQAVGGTNGPGPYLIENNYLEAAGENVMFGGSDPYIPNLVPSNITIRRNVIDKQTAWMTQSWTVKNLIELKNAEHVLIEGNTIQHIWAAGQDGYAIQLTPRNQYNTAPWTIVADVTIQNNIIRHSAAIVNILGYDDTYSSQQTQDIVIRNNLAYDISKSWQIPNHPAYGRFAQIGAAPKNITIDHNTVDNDGSMTIGFYAGTTPTSSYAINGFVLTNNLLRDNKYGIFGDTSSTGTTSLNKYCPNYIVLRNTLANGVASSYPTGNFFPTLASWLADFTAASSGTYTLVSSAPWIDAGLDGKDLGVDFTELNAALSGSTSTSTGGSSSGGSTSAASTPFTGTPIALPGRIEAENYDKGGEGVAYHDTTSGNSGGAYRNDNVDIRSTSDSSGAYNLKSVRASEWLKYTVSIASSGSYKVGLRVASSGGGGTVHISMDGTNVTGAIALPDTGGWNTWQTVTVSGVTLSSGTHVLTLVIDANGSSGTVADINWIDVSGSGTSGSTPFTLTPIALPGTIQMENYDKGGEGVAYHDTTAGNNGGVYRSDDVDLQTTSDSGGGYKVKTAIATEWLNYTANVTTAGTYTIAVRVSSGGGGGTFHVEVNGVNVTGSMTVPNTGDWESWTTVSKAGVTLSAGTQVVRVVMDTTGSSGLTGNFNWLQVQ